MAFFSLSIKYTENCIERGEKSKVFLHVGNANQVSIDVFPHGKVNGHRIEFFPKTNTFPDRRRGGEIMAVFRIEKTRDYTVMANHHLRNTALSAESEGAAVPHAVACRRIGTTPPKALPEYAGMEWTAFVLRSGSWRMRDTLSVKESVTPTGGSAAIEYTILEQPRPPEPKPGKPERENPVQAKPVLDSPVLGKPEQENPAQLNTKGIK